MIGCLCIHGFTGAPYEIEPLVNYLNDHTDWKIVAPTLPGHGEEDDLSAITYQQWIDFVERELETLMEECEVTYLIGFSMGGMLAAYLASKYPVEKLVLLSAAAYYINVRQLYLDVQEMIKDSLKGQLQRNVLFQRYRKKISSTPMSATKQFRLLVRHIKGFLNDVKVPTLIVQGECDGIVPVKSAHFLYKKIGASYKSIVFLHTSPHHVCHGPDFKELIEEICQFLDLTVVHKKA